MAGVVRKCHPVDVRTSARLAALAVTCAVALSLTGATATAQAHAQTPDIKAVTAAAGCVEVYPISANEAGCMWGAPGGRRDGAIIITFDPALGKPTAWKYWDRFPPGTSVIGTGWAASVNGPGAAQILVSRLGGTAR